MISFSIWDQQEVLSRFSDSMLSRLLASLGKVKESPFLYEEIESEAGGPSEGFQGSPSYRSGSRTGRVLRHTRRTPPIAFEFTRIG